jgi:hypothetical protein
VAMAMAQTLITYPNRPVITEMSSSGVYVCNFVP